MQPSDAFRALNQCLDSATEARQRDLDACAATTTWGIYGAGRLGKKLAAALRSKGKAVEFFLDANLRDGAAIEGVRCGRTENATSAMKAIPVVVALHNPQTDSTLVRRQLLAQGFKRVYLLQEVIDFVPQIENFWLAPRQTSIDARDLLAEGLALISEERSREIFMEVLQFRLLGGSAPKPEPDQYFPASLPLPVLPLRFVDAGAFDGDTIDYIHARGWALEWCAAFEPDMDNYAKLAAKHWEGEAILVPCALADSTRDVEFTPDGSAGHMGEGTVWVRTVPLDSVVGRERVNFIKMDIEGAEPLALRGGAATIQRCQPRIALASYHDPLHMATLPILLRELGYEGSFRLRSHAFNSFETVLYGIEPTR